MLAYAAFWKGLAGRFARKMGNEETYLLHAASADELVTELCADLLDLIALSGDKFRQALGETLCEEGQMNDVSGSKAKNCTSRALAVELSAVWTYGLILALGRIGALSHGGLHLGGGSLRTSSRYKV